jgi:putative flippase GtrA
MSRNSTILLRQLFRFAAVGVVNTVVGVGVIMAAYRGLGWGPLSSNAAGYGAGFVLSYVMHRYVTFQSSVPTARSLPRYGMVLGLGYGCNLAVLYALLALGLPFFWAQLCALVTFSTVVFFGSRAFAFEGAA